MYGSAWEARPTARRLARVGVLVALLVLLHAMFTSGPAHVPLPGSGPCASRAATSSAPHRHCRTIDPASGPEDASGQDRRDHGRSACSAALGTLRLPTGHCTAADPGALRALTTGAAPVGRSRARGARRAPALPDPLLLGGVRRC